MTTRRAAAIVQDYNHPQPGSTSTLTIDQKVQREVLNNGIHRPKGYTVSYHANPDMEVQHFGEHHPMKPWRVTLTNKIIMAYGMHEAMDLYLSRAATKDELAMFHAEDYIHFLQTVTPTNIETTEFDSKMETYAIGADCPIFDGLYRYCSLYAGASLDAARKLTSGQSQIAINWSGGLHHAKKSTASGFCYINDIVIAILQLLLHHPRVLYIDIDVHHGDGVEQAFWSTDRVMTLSFHKYDKLNFFPGTGGPDDFGPTNPLNPGAHHSLNVPLNDGVDDEQYTRIFRKVVGMCFATYQPTAIVLQCGGDSLGGDKLGCFNLNIRAHGACVSFVKGFNVPLLVLGGGGYTANNVARVWAHETSLCIGASVHENLPAHTPFLEHFLPDKSLYPRLDQVGNPKMGERFYRNENTTESLDAIVKSVGEQLRYVEGSPSVQMQIIPPDIGAIRDDIDREMREAKENGEHFRKKKERGAGVMGEYGF